MPGPYDNSFLDSTLRSDGLSVLDYVGGYSKVYPNGAGNVNETVDAEENNLIRQFLSDAAARDRANRVDVRDFGVTFGAGVAQQVRITNKTRFALAAARAQSLGVPLYIPPGTLDIEAESADTHTSNGEGTIRAVVRATSNLRVFGTSRIFTVLRFFPAAPSAFGFSAFYVDAYSGPVSLELQGLTLTGPSTGANDPTSVVTNGVRHVGRQNASAAVDYLIVRDCIVDGKFSNGLISVDGNTSVEISNSRVAAHHRDVVVTNDWGTGKWLRASNVVFLGAGYNTASAALHTEPTVNQDLEGLSFSGNTGYAWLVDPYGNTTPLATRISARGCTMTGDYGGLGADLAIIADGTYTQVVMDDWRIDTSDAYILVDGQISNSRIKNTNLGYWLTGLSYENVVHELVASALPSGLTTGGSLGSRVSGVYSNSDSDAHSLVVGDGSAHVDNCVLKSTAVGATSRFVRASSGKLFFKGVRMEGDKVAFSIDTASITEVDLDNVQATSTTSYFLRTDAIAAGTITGRGIRTATTNFYDPGSAATGYQNIELTNRRYDSAIASATALELPTTYSVFHVSGTATINNVYLQNSGTSANQFFSGLITLIADGTWTITNSGNCRLRSAASSRTVAANEVVLLLADPKTSLLYEQ